jgi:hypothetical protein
MKSSEQLTSFTRVGILLSLTLSGCSNSGASDEGELFIKVLDAPATYQQMNITIDRISVHRADATADVGWTIVSTNSTGPFDLLNLRNGRNLQLALSKVPVGTYNQIKLNYGACTLVVDGLEQLLNQVPAIQTGDTLSYGFQIVQGQQLQLTFDFDAFNSLSKSGTVYYFHPEIRIQNTLLSGSILGSVVRPDSLPNVATIHTYTGIDSVSTLCDANGSFQLADLPEQMYSVTILSGDTKLRDTTLSHVTVVRNQKTNLGSIRLTAK